jgi:cyanophycinase-like exopeptidase
MAGTLTLVGAGEFLDSMNAIDRQLLDRAGGGNVMILPTASAPDGVGVPERWITMGVDHFARLGAKADGVLALDRAACDDVANADRVRAANLIYFSGGKPDYLYGTLEDTAVWNAVLQVFDRGGMIAGCSAGAMIMGGYVPEFSMKAGLPWINRWRASFALVPDAIVVPHYNEFPEVLVSLIFGRRPSGSYLIGIDGHTALVGLDHAWQVLGAGRVTVRRGREKQRYTAGQAVSLNS